MGISGQASRNTDTKHHDADLMDGRKFPGGLQQKTDAIQGENTTWFASIRRLRQFTAGLFADSPGRKSNPLDSPSAGQLPSKS